MLPGSLQPPPSGSGSALYIRPFTRLATNGCARGVQLCLDAGARPDGVDDEGPDRDE